MLAGGHSGGRGGGEPTVVRARLNMGEKKGPAVWQALGRDTLLRGGMACVDAGRAPKANSSRGHITQVNARFELLPAACQGKEPRLT